MKYTFLIYLFDVLDVSILLYKFNQTQTTLTQDKVKCLIFQDRKSSNNTLYYTATNMNLCGGNFNFLE